MMKQDGGQGRRSEGASADLAAGTASGTAAGIAIENERKFVLHQRSSELLAEIVRFSPQIMEIRQGYLGQAARIRELTEIDLNGAPLVEPNHEFTYKVNEGIQKIEISKELSAEEFSRLWPLTVCSLSKRRYRVHDGGRLVWEVDFFRNRLAIPDLIIAEVELEDGERDPVAIPEWLREFVNLEVPSNDRRFNNRRLADTRHRAEVMRAIGLIGERKYRDLRDLPCHSMTPPQAVSQSPVSEARRAIGPDQAARQ